MNKKTINVEAFRDPFTVFSSGFAIIIPTEMNNESNKVSKPRHKKNDSKIFKKLKRKYFNTF